ncbi:hypothetical protein GXW83_19015 [Streptacidiphilus sp. PB12-B1b]|uniref:hypothetical protein n=1 Tax=Streptacidiphilus sp. PB12-B1b TaxID=2705012 RepID=UPI0015F7AAD8|nr:hypothetical protein [Streptacidiphilus sp. PB12-B1b]QMU77476.1 hypothetical protein GXW83_19015 [Streptacidiphilus sp. PB12-B1b]
MRRQRLRRLLVDLGIAGSGWVALASTALPAADPLRVLLVTAFTVLGPGAAAVRLAARPPGRRDRPSAALEAAVLTVALSLSLGALVAEGFFLSHGLSVRRALGVLAALTTLLVLLAQFGPRGGRGRRAGRRADRRAARTAAAADGPGRAPGAARRMRGRAVRAVAAAGLLLTAACGGRASAPSPNAPFSVPPRA